MFIRGIPSLFLPWKLISFFLDIQQQLETDYEDMLDKLRGKIEAIQREQHDSNTPSPLICVCTIYYPCFNNSLLNIVGSVGVWYLNRVITRIAKKNGFPLIDLAKIFNQKQVPR